ncbi:MAG: hypothetical protein O2999_05140 [Nitrospirae bacterium]|nr:hypothetical protein [Nitrospirota bacterium]
MYPEKNSMPLFILFDSKTGYLYGHLMASGPDDPFLNDMLEWWGSHCSAIPIGLDYPGLTGTAQAQNTLSSN